MKRPLNEFVYRKARQECAGRSANWIRHAVDLVLKDMTDQINRDDKPPEPEQLDRIEAVLRALSDELKERGDL